jgi:hypothetical protein
MSTNYTSSADDFKFNFIKSFLTSELLTYKNASFSIKDNYYLMIKFNKGMPQKFYSDMNNICSLCKCKRENYMNFVGANRLLYYSQFYNFGYKCFIIECYVNKIPGTNCDYFYN